MKQLPKLTGEGAGFEWCVLLSRAAVALLGAFCYPHVLEASEELLDAHTVLSEIKQAPPTAGPTSEAGQLVADIHRFRTESTTLSPKESTAAWFGLLERALNLGPQSYLASVYDTDLSVPVGVQSVIGALPPPAAWPALREQAQQRTLQSGADYRTLSVDLLAAVLLGDRAATDVDLKAIDNALATVAPESRTALQSKLTRIRYTLTKLYGDPSEIARAFSTQVAVAARTGRAPKVEVPDLVTLVGEPEAAKILTNALSQPVTLDVGSGDATRALAGRIALENVDTLKAAQWPLVDSVDAAPLYEALQRRFTGTLPAPTGEVQPALSFDSAKSDADTYYLLFLLVNGRLAEAQKSLESIAGAHTLEIPKRAIVAMQRAQQNEKLYAFLGGVLRDHPELQAWDVYIEQAAYTGHSVDALATLDSVLKRGNLAPYLRADLQRRRIDALLALDDVSGALRATADLLRAPPSTSDRFAAQRAKAAIRLAGLGRVLGRPELGLAGLRFAEQTLALPAQAGERSAAELTGRYERTELLSSVFAEARKQHRDTDAQRIAIAELKRSATGADAEAQAMEMVGVPDARSESDTALVELVSLYVAANRAADARVLLDEAETWGGRDLKDLLNAKDSLGVPLAVSAARAIAALGERETAVRIVSAAIAQFPGYDGAYELESSIDPRALDLFARQFKADQFEERPLIWTAVVLAHDAKYAAAEQAVRAAIAVDPSDGDEGINDRMRAYSVLADILEAEGDPKAARDYREVVAAIRISEKSDELYALGLLQRAFAGYREALGHFSDAYCIQSRLAVQLSRLGEHEQAAEHYRRAYELMPASFGRVESHCFGCESVFEGSQPQSIAESVFETLAKNDPGNPRVHYLQGYLFEEEGRYAAALPAFRAAVQIDGDYLNAWRHMNQLGGHIYLDPSDRNVVTIKLLELDPQQRHVNYDIGAVGDFTVLWNTVEQLDKTQSAIADEGAVYPLKQSARRYEEKQAQLPAEMRNQIEQYQAVLQEVQPRRALPNPAVLLGRHRLLVAIGRLLSGGVADYMPEGELPDGYMVEAE